MSKIGRLLCIPKAYYVVYLEDDNHMETRVNLVDDRVMTELNDDSSSFKRRRKPIVNWLLIAAILDRILLCLYITLNILTATFIFSKPI